MTRSGIAACLLACLFAGSVPAQERVALTPDQMAGLAQSMLDQGRVAEARQVLQALLERSPDDTRLLLILARLANETGDPGGAVDYAARAYRSSDDPRALYLAARLAAQGHAAQGQDTRGQLWLRRARQYAPSRDAAAGVAEDYQFLRRRNPWSTQLSFGISPTNNVNNGSSADSVFIFTGFAAGQAGLNNEARALSGLAIDLGVSTRYRLQQTRDSITYLNGAISGVTYVLSQEAKDGLQADRDARNESAQQRCDSDAAALISQGERAVAAGEALVAEGRAASPVDQAKIDQGTTLIAQGQADIAAGQNPEPCDLEEGPLTTGSDYAYATLSFGITHRQFLGDNTRPTDFDLSYAKSWYGGDPYSDTLTARVSQDWQLSETSQVGAELSVSRRTFDNGQPRNTRVGLDGNWVSLLDSGDRLSLRGGAARRFSDSISQSYRSLSLGAGYDLAEPVAGLSLGFSGDVWRNYDYPFQILYLAGRVDTGLTLRATAQINELEYFGFTPVVNVEARKVESNVDRFDQETWSIGFDLRSAF